MSIDYSEWSDLEIERFIVRPGVPEEAYCAHLDLAFKLPLERHCKWEIGYYDDGSYIIKIVRGILWGDSVFWSKGGKITIVSLARAMCECWLKYKDDVK